MSSKTKKSLEDIAAALDDVPIDPSDAKGEVERLGVDVKRLAAQVRAKVAAADAADRKRRIDEARDAYAKEIERLERRKHEPKRTRQEQVAILTALLAKAPESVAVHFHKFESSSDEELAELVRSLRHLLGEPDSDDE